MTDRQRVILAHAGTLVVELLVLSVGLIVINEFFGPDFDYFNVKTHEGTYKYATIRTPQNDSSVSIVLNKQSERYEEAAKKVAEYAVAGINRGVPRIADSTSNILKMPFLVPLIFRNILPQ